MNRVGYALPKFLTVLLSMVLCLAGMGASAEDPVWPIRTDLLRHDADIADLWHDVGNVSFWNTKDDLKIAVDPDALGIKEVSIHVVQDPALFDAIVDSKGKPSPDLFDYKTNYVDAGTLADDHLEVIPLSNFEICWGVDPEKCPPYLYVIVITELEGVDEATYAKADNSGAFVRTNRDDFFWGWYVIYPLAKVEPGHFVDANVNGLTYQTPTQLGTTGDGGQFWYIPLERVDLSVGSVPLGDVLGDRRVGPTDLFAGSDLDDNRVLNVARLLQSLDADGSPAQGAINITDPVVACLEIARQGLPPLPPPEYFFADDAAVSALINATIAACSGQVTLTAVSKEEARENLNTGMQAGNLMNRNVSKAPGMKSDKAKLEILPIYVPAQRPDGSRTDVVYHDADGAVIETRSVAKPIVVAYLEEVEGTAGTMDVYVAISMDDGDSWKRKNVSRTADKSSMAGNRGVSEKPMLKVKDDMIFVAWTDKYCRGGRPGYAVTVCPDTDGNGLPDPCEVCRETSEGTVCNVDYTGDDAYFQDDLYGVGGPQRSVFYTEYPYLGEVAYSCVWTSRAVVDPNGNVQWFKPERVTSGRRDAAQLFAGAGDDVAFGIVWQEDPKGLMPGDAEGPGDGWSGANTHSKTDIWFSYIRMDDFGLIDYGYPVGGHGDNADIVDLDPELAGRVKALVPMSLPVKVSDNDVCSLENMLAEGGGEHDHDGEGEGTHRYCGTVEAIGTAEAPGTNPLCAYTVPKANPNGEVHNVCVTADGRLLDGNTGASRANLFLQPYKLPDGTKSAWAIVAYEESKGVGSPPEHEEDEDCGDTSDDPGDDRYKPDMGKNVIYHSFDLAHPEVAGGGGIVNLPETDLAGNPIYLVDEFGALLLDWKGDPQLAYENARRARLLAQPKSKAGASQTVVVVLFRQGEEGHGKPADVFMRRGVASATGNPYAFANIVPGAQNLSSVEPTLLWQDPYDLTKPVKMLRWGWSSANLADSSAKNPHDDSIAHRGALSGDELIIGYSWTPNWGRAANDKYDFYVRRSFNGGQSWTTDPYDPVPIEHNVVFRVPVLDEVNQTVIWDEDVVTTVYGPGAAEPPRNVSNLRNNRMSVLEPRVVKAPGTITDLFGNPTGYPEDVQDTSVYQLAYGLEINQTELPDGSPQMPLDIYYSRTRDAGQRFESVIVTPQGGTGKPQEGWNPLAKDKPLQGAAQIRQTPDGSRMYAIWLEEDAGSSDIMFRRVDYR